MDPIPLVLIFFGSVLLAIFVGYPFGVVLGGLAVFFTYGLVDPSVFPLFINRLYGIMGNFVLIAIPLFVFMGVMLEKSTVANDLYMGMHVWFGPLHGGLAIGTIVLCTLLATCTGVVAASVVSVGLLAYPGMVSRGTQKRLALGTIAAGGTLGILIPPSIMLVTYAAFSGGSAGKLFFGAFIPGLLLSLSYILYIAIRCHLNPSLGPPLPLEERNIPLKPKIMLGLRSVMPPFVLLIAVLGSIFLGVATPTEASAMGATGAVALAVAKRQLNWNVIKETCLATLRTTSMILLIFHGATVFVAAFQRAGGSAAFHHILLGMGLGPYGSLLVILFVVVVLGCFIDWIGIIIINVSIFAPIVQTLGFDMLWFAVIICVALQTAFLTPPYGGSLVILKGIVPPDVTMRDIIIGSLPFVLFQIIVILLCVLFPATITWLPAMMVKWTG
jgi:tripartite ATP-independent transporter DctM subunit